ncbi:MAG TPA: Ig-like domain-containing protein [Candidatus Woesebacteria bacterium]|nr:Ig-like domain-containing protein [Candidatus Woesebacteria bacterium]
MKKFFCKQERGIASIFVLLGMLVIAVSLPVATKLVQQNQENRSQALPVVTKLVQQNQENRSQTVGEGDGCCTTAGSPSDDKCNNILKYCNSSCECVDKKRKGSSCAENRECINDLCYGKKCSVPCEYDGVYYGVGSRVCNVDNSGSLAVYLYECGSADGQWKNVQFCDYGCENGACKEATTSTSSAPASTCSATNCGNCGTVSNCTAAGCKWDYSGNYCVKKMTSPAPASTCSATNCGNCNQAQCSQLAECRWAGGACIPVTTALVNCKCGGSFDECENGDWVDWSVMDSELTHYWKCKCRNSETILNCLKTKSTSGTGDTGSTSSSAPASNCSPSNCSACTTVSLCSSTGGKCTWSNGACITTPTTICTSGTYKCDGRNLMVCKSDGSGWNLSEECGIDQTCNSITKTCDTKVTIINPSGIKLSASKISLYVGEKQQITATVEPENASNKTVTWSTSNNLIASVSDTGMVIAKSIGTATLTAKTVNGKTAEVNVEVKTKAGCIADGKTYSIGSKACGVHGEYTRDNVYICNSDGKWSYLFKCEEGCKDGACNCYDDGSGKTYSAGSKICDSAKKNVITCKSNGNWSDKENCPNGCENGACKEATTSTSSAPASTCSDTKCSLCNQAQCYQKSKCEWNDSLGRCVQKTSTPSTTSTTGSISSAPASTCSASNCGDCATVSNCTAAGCKWDYSGNYCVKKMTSPAPASTCSATNCGNCNQAQCYQKSKCEWNDSLGRCVQKTSTPSTTSTTGSISSAPASTCSASNCGDCATVSNCTAVGCKWDYSGNYCVKKTASSAPATVSAECAPLGVQDNLVLGDDLCVKGVPSEFKTTTDGWSWKCGGSGYRTVACSAKKSTADNRPTYCYGSCLTRDVCLSRQGQVLPLGSGYTRYSNCDDGEICCVNISSGPPKCGVSSGKTLVPGDDLCEVGSYSDFKANSLGWSWKCSVSGYGTVSCNASKGVYGRQCAEKKDEAFCALPSQCTGTNYGQVDCENGKICCGETTVKIDGVCGTDKLSCQAGTVDDEAVADTNDFYKWACRGIHGGKDALNCSYRKSAPVVPMLVLSANNVYLYPGESQQITATLKPETAKVDSWTSSNKKIATVTRKTDKVGVIRAVAPGSVDVVVKASNGKTSVVRVVVGEKLRLTPVPTKIPTSTILPTGGTTLVPTATPTNVPSTDQNCTNPAGKHNDRLCFVDTKEIKTCVNGVWSNPVACEYGCKEGSNICNSAPTKSEVSFKITFDGVRPNAECISVLDQVDVEVANVPTNKYQGNLKSNFSLTEGEVDSRNNQVFQVNNLVLNAETFDGVNNFNYIRVKGPFHLKRRMCQDNQNGKVPEHVACDISLEKSDKVYNFKNYTLLAGDTNRDGVINTVDRSFVKSKFNPSAEVSCGREGDLNLDGVVNSIDMDLVKHSLSEIDDE